MVRENDHGGLSIAVVPQHEQDLTAHDRSLDTSVDSPIYNGEFIDVASVDQERVIPKNLSSTKNKYHEVLDHESRSVQVHNEPETAALSNETIAL